MTTESYEETSETEKNRFYDNLENASEIRHTSDVELLPETSMPKEGMKDM
jgi:hypothetical protein